jgi:hypothetical protein
MRAESGSAAERRDDRDHGGEREQSEHGQMQIGGTIATAAAARAKSASTVIPP